MSRQIGVLIESKPLYIVVEAWDRRIFGFSPPIILDQGAERAKLAAREAGAARSESAPYHPNRIAHFKERPPQGGARAKALPTQFSHRAEPCQGIKSGKRKAPRLKAGGETSGSRRIAGAWRSRTRPRDVAFATKPERRSKETTPSIPRRWRESRRIGNRRGHRSGRRLGEFYQYYS